MTSIISFLIFSIVSSGRSYLLDSSKADNITNILHELSVVHHELQNNKATLDILNQAFNFEVASRTKVEQDLQNLTKEYNKLKARNEVLENGFTNVSRTVVSNHADLLLLKQKAGKYGMTWHCDIQDRESQMT